MQPCCGITWWGSSSRCSAAREPILSRCTEWKRSSDDRPPCLENPRPEGAESTLTENAASPFQAEPRQGDCPILFAIENCRNRIVCWRAYENQRFAYLVCHSGRCWIDSSSQCSGDNR